MTIAEFVPPNPIPPAANVDGMWSPVYPWPLIAVHSALLPDGRVMTYGSNPNGQQTGFAKYDIWDSNGAPDTGHLTLDNPTGTDIFCSSQVLLPQSGNLFIAGGDVWTGAKTTNQPNSNSNLYDSASMSLTRGMEMNRARWYSSSITLINGETYIQGGSGGSDRPEIRGLDGTFRLMTGISTSGLGNQYPRNFVALDGKVFGYAPANGQMYRIDTAGNGTITMLGRFDTAYSGGWFSSTAMYRPGRILQIGGTSNGAYTIDITGSSPVVAQTQTMSSTRAWVNATVLADGKVLATSGSAVPGSTTGYNNIAEIWDPATGQWHQGAVAQKMRLYHSNALLLPDGSVLVSGGGAISPTSFSDPNKNNLNAEIYYPPYLFASTGPGTSVRAARPTLAKAPAWIDIGKTFALDVADTASVSRVTLVKTGSTTHSFNMDQRFLDLTFNQSGTQVAVQAPTRAGEAPPGFYLLFVFNEAGVPSIGKIVRMGIATDPNPAIDPVLPNPGPQVSTVGGLVDLVLNGGDPNGDVLIYAATGLPPGLAIDAGSGRVTGMPTTTGSYSVVVSVTDGINNAAASFVWTTQAPSPLILESLPAPAFAVANGVASYAASAIGGTGLMYKWSFGDGSPDTDWAISASAAHAYASPGTYVVTVYAKDDSGQERSRSAIQAVYLPATPKKPAASGNLLVENRSGASPRLWVVNQDNDSVSVFDATSLAKLGEVVVGIAPRSIARAPNGMIWVVAKQGGNIKVISPSTLAVARTINLARGSQPFGIVMSPVANVAYVTLEAGGRVLKFDTTSYAQTGSAAIGLNARHLSISGDGARLYVSRYVTPPLPGEGTPTVAPTASTGGEVLQLDAASLGLVRTIVLQHGDKDDGETQGRGIPNYLGAAVISPDGSQAFVPSKQDNVKRGALRDGTGLNFQNTVRAISSRIDLSANAEDLAARVDHDNASVASAAVYEPRGVYLFVALETSREVAVIDAFSRLERLRFDVGQAPQGLAISADGLRLYVNNFMDRTVGVYDLGPLLQGGRYSVPLLATLSAVANDKLVANVLAGKKLFYDARDPRLAAQNYMSCASCHNDGGQDGRVWDLTAQGEGLRNTIALRGRAGMGQGFLHWSANFDEVQDFEGQIRALAGGTGLASDSATAPLGTPKAGLSADLDALAAYVASLTAFAPAPARPGASTLSAGAAAGQAVFTTMNCAACHSGAAFTGSGASTSVDVGTIKPSSGARLFGRLSGIDVPTLRDVWASAPYLHDGSAPTLEAAVRAHANVSVGDDDLAKLVAYLKEIGSDEPSAPAPAGAGTGLTGMYFDNNSLSGTPVLTRVEAVNFGWSSGSPGTGLATSNFSARWTGRLVAPAHGTYRIQTAANDGVRVWVDGALLIDHWQSHTESTPDTSAPFNLSAGDEASIIVEYWEGNGTATMRLRWITPGNTAAVAIPTNNLLPN
jgi:YVTN family beta-propeller protein